MLETIFTSLGYDIGPRGPWVIVFLTFVLGTAAAWRTGQAVASSWSPSWPLAFYALLLSGAVQFLHYALFQGPLFSAPNGLLDAVYLTLVGLLGHRFTRARLMAGGYAFGFERRGPFGWRRKTAP